MSPAERDLLDGLVATLAKMPGMTVLVATLDVPLLGVDVDAPLSKLSKRGDALLAVEVLGTPAQLLIEAKAYGYPRDLRNAADQVLQYVRQQSDAALVPMVVSDAISPGGKELLRSRGVGYWDRSGSLYLQLPGALFYVDRPAARATPRRLRSLYRGSAAQVLHALLLEPGRTWHVQELAARAEVSISRVHEVFSALEQHLWLEKRGRGPAAVRTLIAPGALLDNWAEAHSLKEYGMRLFHGWSQSPSSLRSAVTVALDQYQVPYALTSVPGAELVAPFVTGNDRLTLIVQDHLALDQVAADAGLSPVDDGENVCLLVTRARAPLLFRRSIDSLQVASTVQLYLDLWASPRRGKEQARHLRAERLPY